MKPIKQKQFIVESINNYGVVNLNIVDSSFQKESGVIETNSSIIHLGKRQEMSRINLDNQKTLPLLRNNTQPIPERSLDLSCIPPRRISKKSEETTYREISPKKPLETEKKREKEKGSNLITKSIYYRPKENKGIEKIECGVDEKTLFDSNDLSTIPKQPDSMFIGPIQIKPLEKKPQESKEKDNGVTLSFYNMSTEPISHYQMSESIPALQSTAMKEMTSISDYLTILTELMEKEYFQVIFDGISYYEGFNSIEGAFQSKNITIIFETEESVFGVNHKIETGEKWNRDYSLSVFCLKGIEIEQPTLFRCYRYSSSRLIDHQYQVLGFCEFDIDTAIMCINNKFHVHFIDFVGKGSKIFATHLNQIKINSFALIQWI